jgi:hypothetical protein
MPIPHDLEERFKAVAVLAEREREEAEKRRRAEADAARLAARLEHEERRKVRPAARAIWAWVVGPEASRLRELAEAAALPDLALGPPLWPNGEAAPELCAGCWEVSLWTRGVALRFFHLMHYMGGPRGELRSAAEIAKVLPPAVILQLEADLRTGRVWDTLRRDVGNVGALVRRWQDDEELRTVTALEADRS